jgi:hypothetical protein
MAVESAVSTGRKVLADILVRGTAQILTTQLPTGEIPTFRLSPEGHLQYCRSPFISTFVYDALGYFDPFSPFGDIQTREMIPYPLRSWFGAAIGNVRRGIRRFVAWQQEPGAVWRFFGSGSGIDPDSDTTSCAASLLLESPPYNLRDDWRKHFDALTRFRSAEGIYFSYVTRDQRGYSWMDSQGRPIIGFDRVVNANVLRYLAFIDGQVEPLIAYLEQEVQGGEFRQGSPDYPNPLCFFYMVARAWRQARLPGLQALASEMVPRIVELQTEAGDFGGPLSTALAASALIDLEYEGPALGRARSAILRLSHASGGWDHEPFFVGGFGSNAWTTALSMSVLARSVEVTKDCAN